MVCLSQITSNLFPEETGTDNEAKQTEDDFGYKSPAPAVRSLLEAIPVPSCLVSHDRRFILLQFSAPFTSLAQLAEPELSMAGFRLNPDTNNTSRLLRTFTRLQLYNVDTGATHEVPVPDYISNQKIIDPKFSPDSKNVSFIAGNDIWILKTESLAVTRLPVTNRLPVCYLFGWGTRWSRDSNSILYRTPDPERPKQSPLRPSVPIGPTCFESQIKPKDPSSKTSAGDKTYQDLLKDEHDCLAFEYYCTTVLVLATLDDNDDNNNRILNNTRGIITTASISPDGQHILVKRIKRPFSFFVPYMRFPETCDLFFTTTGQHVRHLYSLPLAHAIPISFDACRTGPRQIQWLDSNTLVWAECQDSGDPRKKVDDEIRDVLFSLHAPFSESGTAPRVVLAMNYRFYDLNVDEELRYLVVEQRWRKTRKSVTTRVELDEKAHVVQDKVKIIWERAYDDKYEDPGSFVCKLQNGVSVIDRQVEDISDQDAIWVRGIGASPSGDHPFLDRYNITTHESVRLWQCSDPYYEHCVAILGKDRILVSRESLSQPAQLHIVQLSTGKDIVQVTYAPHPAPSLNDMPSELIRYNRATDDLPLSGYLYLPPGYDSTRDGPLPTLIWAYPREFVNEKAAGQTQGSPYTFPFLSSRTPLYFVMQGYAVLDKATMPIVASTPDEEPNDTYITQLVANAASAIDALVARGVTDRTRVAVGGHSYGAFMTCNLLAHSKLFAAGVARSGAYNRTLTPNGFQAEERTLWQVPQLYMDMSPYMAAHKISTPLLLIHGEKDNNMGTHPMQSERMFSALKGHGNAPTRLVLLPLEAHGYKTLESNAHVLYEMSNWLDRWCKNKQDLAEANVSVSDADLVAKI
ncbi:hypothetical protein HK100_005275 [Physocladia obscura]|uniref:Dipeptidyl-peptidase V n=1 Tax=Physocladia obscura TaxID=109957 RepID=A0AAD5SXI3_9FUNG|nr:hypothetical protein HK100_005275 [Physocladia obscura]